MQLNLYAILFLVSAIRRGTIELPNMEGDCFIMTCFHLSLNAMTSRSVLSDLNAMQFDAMQSNETGAMICLRLS